MTDDARNQIFANAEQAGLPMTPEDADAMVAAVQRNRDYGRVIRSLITLTDEPILIFSTVQRPVGLGG